MTIQTFETSKGTLIAARLIDGAESLHLFNDYATNPNWNSYISYIVGEDTRRFYLPPGDWKEIGLWGSVPEEKAEEVVEWVETGQYYLDYSRPAEAGWNGDITALESLQSLLETGIKLSNKMPHPKENVTTGYSLPLESNEFYLHDVERWQNAESEVWKHFYLIFKTK